MRKTSLGITTIKRNACLRRCLISIKESNFDGQVIIADQNEELSNMYSDFDVDVLDLGYNVGVSKARNAIVDNANADYLFLLEDDAVFKLSALEQLVQRMQDNPQYGWISPMIDEISVGRKMPHAADWKVSSGRIEQRFFRGIRRQIEDFIEVDQAASIALYNTDVFDEVRWDNDVPVARDHFIFAWYFKDTDWKAGVDPEALISHSGCPYSPGYDKLRHRKVDISGKIGGREVVDNY